MSGTVSMMGVDSPISLRSTDSRAPKQTARPPSRSNDRPSYRLFPSVEPTPPASPIIHRKPISRSTEARTRSSSADDAARRQNGPVRQVAYERGRKVSIPEVQPMSTVQESPIDSPTVPLKYTSPSFMAEDTIHSRSSSAPRERTQRPGLHTKAPSESRLRTAWPSRYAESPPQAVAGLGLTLPTSQYEPRTPRRVKPGKPKPNLRINVDHEDRPPPPPPKSPRHSRDPSAASIQSGVSSMHGESPDSATVVTPGSIRGVDMDTRPDPMPTPKPLKAEQASYMQTNGQFRVREVAIAKDRNKHGGSAPKLPDPTTNNLVISTIPAPDVDKPMPSLPTPNRRFSAHLREVEEAEKSEKAIPETSKDNVRPPTAQSASSVETIPSKKPSLAPPGQTNKQVDIQQFPLPLRGTPKPSARDIRTPTPDLVASRPQSPANLLQTVSTGAKTLPVLPNEGPPFSRSATPDSSAALSRTVEPKSLKSDPLQTMQDLNKQSEALHARYASLRADRVKISTAISASLKDEKPGSDYANNLLDQHLALNAINSSMDICFAKLKSLDCRKEEAMQAFMREIKTKSMMGESVKSVSTTKSLLAPPLPTGAELQTPAIGAEPKSLTPELIPTSKFSNKETSPPKPTQAREQTTSKDESEDNDPPTTEKRITIIRASTASGETVSSSEPMPISPISSIHDMYSSKRIRIKGAKAAKILGLVAQSATGTENGRGITLPDKSPGMPATFKKPIAVEVEIQERPVQKKPTTTPPTSGTTPQMPKRQPPPTPKHDTKDSVSSSVASSQTTESSPEEPEVLTPTGSDDVPFGLKSAKRGMLQTMATMQTIQVYVDDDILDYYNGQAGP